MKMATAGKQIKVATRVATNNATSSTTASGERRTRANYVDWDWK